MKTFNLDQLVAPAGRALLFGEERDVMQLDGFGYDALYQLEEAGNTDIRPLYDVVARVIPSLTPEQVKQLTAVQVGAILALSRSLVKAVEDSFPNSDGPTEQSPPALE